MYHSVDKARQGSTVRFREARSLNQTGGGCFWKLPMEGSTMQSFILSQYSSYKWGSWATERGNNLPQESCDRGGNWTHQGLNLIEYEEDTSPNMLQKLQGFENIYRSSGPTAEAEVKPWLNLCFLPSSHIPYPLYHTNEASDNLCVFICIVLQNWCHQNKIMSTKLRH